MLCQRIALVVAVVFALSAHAADTPVVVESATPTATESQTPTPVPAAIQTPTAVAAPAITPAPVIATNPLNMAWGILFLLALVGAAWWLIRRSGGLQLQSGRGMKMVSALQVGPRERVVLIEMAGQQWLLGVAPGNVNLLQHFEQPIVQNSGGDDFASKIRAVLQQGANR
jgi:flagellar protein FliO/FliZ